MRLVRNSRGWWEKANEIYRLVLGEGEDLSEAEALATADGFVDLRTDALWIIRRRKLQQLKQKYDNQLAKPLKIGVYKLSTAPAFRLSLLIEKLKADADAGYECPAFVLEDGDVVSLNATQITLGYDTVEERITTLNGLYKAKKDEIEAATTEQEIRSIIWN